MSFAEKLKSHQTRLGLTQAELAAFLDVSPRAVWQWLQGKEPKAITREGALARLMDDSRASALEEIWKLSQFDWDTMPEPGRRAYHAEVSKLSDNVDSCPIRDAGEAQTVPDGGNSREAQKAITEQL